MRTLRIIAKTADGLETVIITTADEESLDINEELPIDLEIVDWYVAS